MKNKNRYTALIRRIRIDAVLAVLAFVIGNGSPLGPLVFCLLMSRALTLEPRTPKHRADM